MSYPGDVPIPIDQPLLGRCGKCGEWVVYGIEHATHRTTHKHAPGLLLASTSRRGGRYLLLASGKYRTNGDAQRWAGDVHRCRPPGPALPSTIARARRRKRQRQGGGDAK